MAKENLRNWWFSYQINLSVLIQLILLAGLIVGSWVNLQRQLDLLQHDVTVLLQVHKTVEQKLESLWDKSIAYEYRLRTVEKQVAERVITTDGG